MERIVESLLLGLDLHYIDQWRFGGQSADFYLPDYQLAIECDGDHWHSLPTRVQDDLRKERAYRERSIRVLHFTETEITGDIKGCKERLLAAVAEQ